jgi:hypothetical protein
METSMVEQIRGLISKTITPVTLAAGVLFALFVFTGLRIYADYGIAWDESTQVEMGLKNYLYVMKGDDSLLSWRDRLYGPFFEIVLVTFQARAPSSAVYLSRHLLNFLFFAAGVLGFFFLALRYLRKPGLALAGAAFLVLSPRIFADAFYNSKDIPFLVLYIFSLLSLFWLLDRPGPTAAAAHALFCSALIATRLPGLIVPALTLAALLLEVINRRIRLPRALLLSALYVGLGAGLVVLFWPALWPDPTGEFAAALHMMTRFPHQTAMRYLGQTIASDSLPWHYIPVWMAVTTPLPYLALFVTGLTAAVAKAIPGRGLALRPEPRDRLLVLAALFGPLLAVIVFRSTLYDGWRQMFFLYSPFLLIALDGAAWVLSALERRTGPRRAQVGFTLLLILAALPAAARIAADHPYQNVYFNRLAGPDMQTAQQRFALDYWGLAYREGLDYILRSDPDARITVRTETAAGERSAAIFPREAALRLRFVERIEDAKYYLGNYYYGPQSYGFENEVYTVWSGSARLLSVFLLTEEDKY